MPADFQRYSTDTCSVTCQGAGLSLQERSLATCTVLVALARENEQHAHFRGARNVGIERAKLEAMITHVAHYAGWPVTATALRVPHEVWTAMDAEDQGVAAIDVAWGGRLAIGVGISIGPNAVGGAPGAAMSPTRTHRVCATLRESALRDATRDRGPRRGPCLLASAAAGGRPRRTPAGRSDCAQPASRVPGSTDSTATPGAASGRRPTPVRVGEARLEAARHGEAVRAGAPRLERGEPHAAAATLRGLLVRARSAPPRARRTPHPCRASPESERSARPRTGVSENYSPSDLTEAMRQSERVFGAAP